MADLAVIVSAQFTFLLAIIAWKIYVRQTDVLSGRYLQNDGDYSSALAEHFARADATIIERAPQPRTTAFHPAQPARASAYPEASPHPDAETGHGHAGPLQSFRATATLPAGTRIYAIGDIHGRADLLRNMLERIGADRKQRPVERPILLFIGDYIDRGPSSREVIDILLKCRDSGESIFLKGNHEAFITRFLKEPAVLGDWRQCGGLETLLSYGLKPSFTPDEGERVKLSGELAAAMSVDQRAFLNSLPLSFQCGGFLFVHAGIRPDIPLADQVEEDLLWIREDFLGSEAPFGVFVVHGHTPVREPELRSNRINIDTGAFATGRLTCAVIEGSTITTLSTEPEGHTDPAPAGP